MNSFAGLALVNRPPVTDTNGLWQKFVNGTPVGGYLWG